MLKIDALRELLGSDPGQPRIQALLNQLHNSSKSIGPEVRAYPDVVYHNYRSLGLSLQYEACTSGDDASKSTPENLRLAAIDIYSGHDDKHWTCFSALPLQVDAISSEAATHPRRFLIKYESTGKDLVSDLGEPQRKGGGANDRSGPAAWMEWCLGLNAPGSDNKKRCKLQVELAGPAARGADRWNAEKAGACTWAVITITNS